MALKVEMKFAEFKEKQVSIESMLTEQVTKESFEQTKGSIVKMNAEHDELQDVYNQWYYKINKIIEERKEQRRGATTSGSGTNHK